MWPAYRPNGPFGPGPMALRKRYDLGGERSENEQVAAAGADGLRYSCGSLDRRSAMKAAASERRRRLSLLRMLET